jgi:hypothetical protein
VSAQSMPLAAESAVRRAATPLLTWAWEQFGEQFGDHFGDHRVVPKGGSFSRSYYESAMSYRPADLGLGTIR